MTQPRSLSVTSEDAKRLAAQAAFSHLPHTGVIGLGSGTTAMIFIELLGQALPSFAHEGRSLVGVPTSARSRMEAERVGVPLLPDEGPWSIDLCVDGADEVDAKLCLIKGGGGALTREKIVNQAAKVNIVIVDESKLSENLGQKWSVPVEVVRFGHASTARALELFGKPVLRQSEGVPFATDSGGYIYDIACGVIEDPAALDKEIRAVPGVIETGLFINRVSLILVASANGVRELRPSTSSTLNRGVQG